LNSGLPDYSLVQGLAGLVDAVDESIGDQGLLQDLLQGGVNVHGAIEDGGSGGNITAAGEQSTLAIDHRSQQLTPKKTRFSLACSVIGEFLINGNS